MFPEMGRMPNQFRYDRQRKQSPEEPAEQARRLQQSGISEGTAEVREEATSTGNNAGRPAAERDQCRRHADQYGNQCEQAG
jgi:hypothetical protein